MPASRDTGRGASHAAAGVIVSRVLGLVRDRFLTSIAGLGLGQDLVQAALRIPNLVQNLLGEQALSAAVIPVYARLRASGRSADAGSFMRAVFVLLLLAAGLTATLGALLAPWLVPLVATGWSDRPELAEPLVAALRWLFPMTGVLVLSSWCLAVLNSHRRFFLPYAAPALWNLVIITGLYWLWRRSSGSVEPSVLLRTVAISALLGSVLQFAVQIPSSIRLLEKGPSEAKAIRQRAGVPEATRRFGPALTARGAAQASTFLETWLASFLVVGSMGTISLSQRLYVFALAILGTAFSAAELPRLSEFGDDEVDARRERLRDAICRNLFLSVPTTLGLVFFAPILARGVFGGGRFQGDEAWLVAVVLLPYALALVPTTVSRLLQSAFFSLGDTATPARFGILRLFSGFAIAIPLMFWLDSRPLPRIDGSLTAYHLGPLGLAVGALVGSASELLLLSKRLSQKLEGRVAEWRRVGSFFLLALPGIVLAGLVSWLGSAWHPSVRALAVVSAFGGVYLTLAVALGVPEAEWIRRLRPGSRSEH